MELYRPVQSSFRNIFLACWLFFALPAPLFASVVINEIHYNPAEKTEPGEFVELYNHGTAPVNLSGWMLDGAIHYTFPVGTSLPSGGFVTVAQNPAFLKTRYGADALGPFTNRLSKYGDRVILNRADGSEEDRVEYKLGFPWPTVGNPDHSIELIHPALDNDLAGSWRSSNPDTAGSEALVVLPKQSDWKYFKGTSEASSPRANWRQVGFNDSSWLQGQAPIGYGEGSFIVTELPDMRGFYTSVFFRKTFVVAELAQFSAIELQAAYDDGFKLWINGSNVYNANISSGELAFNGTSGPAIEGTDYKIININNLEDLLRPGTNVVAVQVHNSDISASSDFFFDAQIKLVTGGTSGAGPTPGRTNSVYSESVPPQVRQVGHRPEQPRSGQPVQVTAKVTDPQGVASVKLQYQIVQPGNYIELTDPAYFTSWTDLPMQDNGVVGDELAGDGTFTVMMPSEIQVHRRLIRYRIVVSDNAGNSLKVPYADDPQPNFAYFVYDGVPEWTGSARPGVVPPQTFRTNEMQRLPAVHLIGRSNTVATATWFSRYGGDEYPWAGTLVYDGKVYDHVHYRARGGVWRYAMVKNMWKFDLNRGHELEMRDDFGVKYNTKWRKLNLGACIQQADFNHRGEQGMFESVGFKLFNLAGVESPNTTFVQFRVIDEVAEAAAQTQFEGDFWGLYLAIEQEDGEFLDQHDLPDGNLYKMEGGTGSANNIGPNGPIDRSDLDYFLGTYAGNPDETWWKTNLFLEKYYSYRTIVEGIHHYDIDQGPGKNYFYYRNPDTELWSVHSWDLDLTWADNMYGGGDEPFRSRVLPKPVFSIEFRNRVRELRDLLFNTNQAFRLIDEMARLVRGKGVVSSILEADRAMWDWNPKMASGTYSSSLGKAGQGRFYQFPGTVSKDFNGAIQLMKNYIVTRGALLDNRSNDPSKPGKPAISFQGGASFAINRLRFKSSGYSGISPFRSIKWRIAEITPAGPVPFEPVKYEITDNWNSGELPGPADTEIEIPAAAVREGRTYRVRARVTDNTGRTSNWSDPIEFVATAQTGVPGLVQDLHLTELMYNSPAGSGFDFVELRNDGPNLLDLGGVKFTQGIDFTFANGVKLSPGEFILVVKAGNIANFAAFRAHYGISTGIRIAGTYSGNLDSAGETLTLKTSAGGTNIFSFTYGDGRGWPLAADGAGHSLVPLTLVQNDGRLDYGGNWRASRNIKGSPGKVDPSPDSPVVLNEIVTHTDFLSEFDSNDWIELYNRSASPFTFGPGWYLSDSVTNLQKWMIPANTTIPAGGFVSFDERTGFHNPTNTGFGLNKNGEDLFLSSITGTAEDRVIDSLSFKAQENERSFGRLPDGGPFWETLGSRTRNLPNAVRWKGVSLTEVMYHPPDIQGTNDNGLDEFLEIYNPGSGRTTFGNTNGSWRLNGGIDFIFPSNSVLDAGKVMLIVSFNPTNIAQLALFRSKYGVPNQVPVLGPYLGKLNNGSDRVVLEKPEYSGSPADPQAWVIVDELVYADRTPWDDGADGTGKSLHRKSLDFSANDPSNWSALMPTAGTVSFTPVFTDSDGDRMPDPWEIVNQFDPQNPADAILDADLDGMTNLQEYQAGTNPRSAASALKFLRLDYSDAGLVLGASVVSGRSYIIQYKEYLEAGEWIDLILFESDITGEKEILLPTSGNVRFYRLITPVVP